MDCNHSGKTVSPSRSHIHIFSFLLYFSQTAFLKAQWLYRTGPTLSPPPQQIITGNYIPNISPQVINSLCLRGKKHVRLVGFLPRHTYIHVGTAYKSQSCVFIYAFQERKSCIFYAEGNCIDTLNLFYDNSILIRRVIRPLVCHREQTDLHKYTALCAAVQEFSVLQILINVC